MQGIAHVACAAGLANQLGYLPICGDHAFRHLVDHLVDSLEESLFCCRFHISPCDEDGFAAKCIASRRPGGGETPPVGVLYAW